MASDNSAATALPAGRSKFTFVAPVGSSPACWALPSDSIVAKALDFIGWSPNSAATKLEAPRSTVAGALLIQTTAPLAANLQELDDLSILEHEMGVDRASAVAHVLDKAKRIRTKLTYYVFEKKGKGTVFIKRELRETHSASRGWR